MVSEFFKSEMAEVARQARAQIGRYAEVQRQRTYLTGTGSARRGKVTVTVNADGALTDVKFGRNVEELEYPELSKALLEAADAAVADVRRKNEELLAPVQEEQARLPRMSDLVPGMPDFGSIMPSSEPAPLRNDSTDPESEESPMVFRNTETVEERSKDRGVTDSGW
ncbi:YbaB/EbfC family nucleoid-associated protein [Nocardia sp. BMG51109]|uniref:YbaB/EbfC family nucleoid-associated protein n=1 Tax=Nocardia sp. BMG51109 TaxID=1056816 RepID=UPI000462F35C|nr:YbaB/EbfC family nucleoid-associated protein [Nocardia sp. BMG51109]